MTKKEIKSKMVELLSSGISKTDVFTELSGRGVKDSQLAYYIASYPNPTHCIAHKRKVNIVITLTSIAAILGCIACFGLEEIGPNAKWLIVGIIILIQLLFVWGFYTNRVVAYNVFILLSIVQLPKSLEGFTSSPIISSIGIAINLGILVYVWYVRQKLFPDFIITTPKKIKGQYVFTG